MPFSSIVPRSSIMFLYVLAKSFCQHFTAFGQPSQTRSAVSSKSAPTSLLYAFSRFCDTAAKHSSRLLNASAVFSRRIVRYSFIRSSEPISSSFIERVKSEPIISCIFFGVSAKNDAPSEISRIDTGRSKLFPAYKSAIEPPAKKPKATPNLPKPFNRFANNALMPKIPIVTTADGEDIEARKPMLKPPLPAAVSEVWYAMHKTAYTLSTSAKPIPGGMPIPPRPVIRTPALTAMLIISSCAARIRVLRLAIKPSAFLKIMYIIPATTDSIIKSSRSKIPSKR